MGKIFCLIGKSAAGKDALYNALLNDEELSLKPFVTHTTRPRREGEQNGHEYFFSTEEEMAGFEKSSKLIEKRTYHTVYGDWFYFSVDGGHINLEEKNYLYIGTLESFLHMRDYYTAARTVPLYVEVEDGERLLRAIKREQQQKEPGYKELCRRFLADSEDYSEEKLAQAGIKKRFNNAGFDECVREISSYIKEES